MKFLLLPLLAAAISIATALTLATTSMARAVDQPCVDVDFIFARGSGGELQRTAEATRFFKQLETKVPSNTISSQSYELGTEIYGSSQYPAVTINDAGNFIGAVFSQGMANDYGDSVRAGVKELQGYLTQRTINCPSAQFILGGYSQGAQVIGQALAGIPQTTRDKIILASLFGDPKLNLPEGRGFNPPACRGEFGENLSPWRREIGNCRTSAGRLLARDPYVPDDMKNRVGTWCAEKDTICGSSSITSSGHGTYAQDSGMIDKAADESIARMSKIFTLIDELPSNQKVDIALILDARCHIASISGTDMEQKMRAFHDQLRKVVTDSDGRIRMVTSYEIDETPHYYTPYDQDVIDKAISQMYHAGWRSDAKHIFLTEFHCYEPTFFKDPILPPGASPSYPKQHEINPATENMYDYVSREVININYNESTIESLINQANEILTHQPLQADFSVSAYEIPTNTPVYFDASQSLAYGEDTIISYQWDFDEDRLVDAVTTQPYASYTYTENVQTGVSLRIVSSSGGVSTARVFIDINSMYQPPDISPPPAAPIKLTHKKVSPTSISISWQPGDSLAATWQIRSDGVIIGNTVKEQLSATIVDYDFTKPADISVTGVSADGSTGEVTSTAIPEEKPQDPEPAPKPERPPKSLSWRDIWAIIIKLIQALFNR